jgi:hypothetical protein
MRVLCEQLRRAVGGLCDIESPLDEVSRLDLHPSSILIVENLATGLALPDLPGTVALMKLGMAVTLLGTVSWFRGPTVHYWGDIDTHGFAILSHARSVFPDLKSLLMDGDTLLANRPLWVQEDEQHRRDGVQHLSPDERAMFDDLQSGRWGERVRLEQERLPWPEAIATILREISFRADARD